MKVEVPRIDAEYIRVRDEVAVRVIDAVGGPYGFIRLARVDSPARASTCSSLTSR